MSSVEDSKRSSVHSILHECLLSTYIVPSTVLGAGMTQRSVLPTVSRFTLVAVGHVKGCYRSRRVPNPVSVELERDIGLQEDFQRKSIETRDQ